MDARRLRRQGPSNLPACFLRVEAERSKAKKGWSLRQLGRFTVKREAS